MKRLLFVAPQAENNSPWSQLTSSQWDSWETLSQECGYLYCGTAKRHDSGADLWAQTRAKKKKKKFRGSSGERQLPMMFEL